MHLNNALEYLKQGKKFFEEVQFDASAACFMQAAELEPTVIEYWAWAAQAYRAGNKFELAINALLRAILLESSPDAIYDYALQILVCNEFAERILPVHDARMVVKRLGVATRKNASLSGQFVFLSGIGLSNVDNGSHDDSGIDLPDPDSFYRIGDAEDLQNLFSEITVSLARNPDDVNWHTAVMHYYAIYENYVFKKRVSSRVVRLATKKKSAHHACLAIDRLYEKGLISSENDEFDAIFRFVKDSYENIKSDIIGSTLCTLLCCMREYNTAADLAESVVAAAPTSIRARVAAMKACRDAGHSFRGVEHFRESLIIDAEQTMWLSSQHSGLISSLLTSTKEWDSVGDLVENLYAKFPNSNYIPIAPTKNHLKKLRRCRDEFLADKVPSCLLVTQGKCASIAVSSIFSTGIGLPSVLYSLGIMRVISAWAKDYASGGACHVTHLHATKDNVVRLRDAGLRKAIVHVRDPRQWLLSLTHHISKYRDQKHMDIDFHSKNINERLDIVIDRYLDYIVNWIDRWVVAQDIIDITFTTFEEMKNDKETFVNKVLSAYGRKDLFDSKRYSTAYLHIDHHFRKGIADEWRDYFTPKQKEKVAGAIPEYFYSLFGWSK